MKYDIETSDFFLNVFNDDLLTA